MILKAIVFDMDGVVIDSTHAWWLTFNQALSYFNQPTVSEEKFMTEILGESTEEDVDKYYPGVKVGELLSTYDRFFAQNISEVAAFPDTLPLLAFLSSAGIRKAIATNTPRELALTTLAHAGLDRSFDAVVTADDVSRGKPDPEMIHTACRLLDVSVNEIIYVGDTVSDVKAAAAAGCRMVGVGVPADEKITRLRELIPIIKAASAAH